MLVSRDPPHHGPWINDPAFDLRLYFINQSDLSLILKLLLLRINLIVNNSEDLLTKKGIPIKGL